MKCIARAALAASCATLLSACYQIPTQTGAERKYEPRAGVDAQVADKPKELRISYRDLLNGGERDHVLNANELAVVALYHGYLDHAAQQLDRSIDTIESLYANSERCAKARSLWYSEGCKDWRGDPYERCMAYYYRGLLYMASGEYDNAKACFGGGLLQDALVEEEQYRCDFAALIFLKGWCALQLGDREEAYESFEEARKLRPGLPLPGADHHYIVIAESGKAPRKLTSGVGSWRIEFRRGQGFSDAKARIALGDRRCNLFPLDDVYWQATTRGGRKIDRIVEGKAEFANNMAYTGEALAEVGQHYIDQSTLLGPGAERIGNIGLGIAAVGVVFQAAGAGTQPEADDRYWRNLPEAIHVATLADLGDAKDVTIEFTTRNGRVISELTNRWNVWEQTVRGCRVGLVWGKAHLR